MTFESQLGRFISYSLLDTLLWYKSENKIRKYLKRPLPPIIGQQLYTPIVISDSKGKYLKDNCSTEIEHNIKWRGTSGRSVEQGYLWLLENITHEIGHFDNIHLYIWLGTCDLTIYDRTTIYISLASESDAIIEQITAIFRKIIEITQKYSSCKLTFLEIPVYSIFEWNKYQRHPTPYSYKKNRRHINISNI